MSARHIPVIAVLALGLSGAGLAAGRSGAAVIGANPGQVPACHWDRLPVSLPQAVYFMGTTWDGANRRMYLSGGLDANDAAQRDVQALDLADTDPARATARLLSPTGPVQSLWASAGAFRVTRPDPVASMALFWGGGEGAGNPGGEGAGQRLLQAYMPSTDLWSTAAVGPGSVLLAAGAVDAAKDLSVFVGGVSLCDFFGVTVTNPIECSDATSSVTFVRFDPLTGDPLAQAGPTTGGPGRVLGGSLVMDTAGQRMLYFGGVEDAETGRARNATFALDLTDPDPARARWSQLTVAGQLPPVRAFHGAAYDVARNWMVIYGGAGEGFFTADESALTDTWILDLGQAPPQWLNLRASTPGQRVGAAMAYADNHQSAVLAGGRRAFATGQQNVTRDAYLLNCGVIPTATPSPTAPTATPLPPTGTATVTATPTQTAPPSATAVATVTATWTAVATATPTRTASPTATGTAPASATAVATATATWTAVATATPTRTVPPTATGTVPASATAVATATATWTAIATVTPTRTAPPTATGTAPPTITPTPTRTAQPTPMPTVTTPPPVAGAVVCPQVAGWRLVPAAVVADAMANPARYYGWQLPNNPAIPPGPYNPLRRFLSLAAPGKPFHPLFNTVMWKAGCP